MRWIAAISLILSFPLFARADENTAIALALADVRTLPKHDRAYQRYIWIPDGKVESLQEVSLTLNYISRATTIIRPTPVAGQLARVDVRHYAPRDSDRDEWMGTWYNFTFDPRFSLLLTKDTLKFSQGLIVNVPDFKDGEDVIKVPSPHLDQVAYANLVNETASQAPIVSHRYFIVRALSAIQDKGAYKTIYGGLYYDFVGIKTGAKKGTDEDAMFEQLGVGDVQSGLTAAKIFEKLRSDQRVAVFRSNITGRPRRADFVRTLASRDGQSIVSVTHDIKQQSIDVGVHPVMNLLDFKDDARELIAEKTNGLHLFALFDGNGKRQDEAPPDVAVDHTIPAPHSTRLQPAIGCIRCHAPDSGWRAVHNDAKKLLGGLLDVFPTRKADEVDRLAGLYSGDVESRLLPRARDDYNSAILRATGPFKASKRNQADIAKLSAERLSNTWKVYWFDLVDASRALDELGVKHDPKKAVETLRKLIPPAKVIEVDGVGAPYVPEDPRIGALLVGLSVNRSDWDLVYSFVATRMTKKRVTP